MTRNPRTSGRRGLVAAVIVAALSLAAFGPLDTWATSDRDDEHGAHDHSSHDHGHDLVKGDLPEEPKKARRVAAATNEVAEEVPATSEAAPVDPIHMKVLVLTATGFEPELGAITQQLEYLGTPYEIMPMAPVPSDPAVDRLAAKLSDLPLETAINAWYQAVILTDASLTYQSGSSYLSALTPAEWASLRAFEDKWDIRQVAWNAWPSADEGFGPVNGSTCTGNEAGTNTWCSVPPIQARYGSAAPSVFGSYANLSSSVPITNSWVNKAPALNDGNSQPLLVDNAGNALAVLRTHRAADGSVTRESITMTFASNQYELNSAVLGYGLVNWATKGMFLGERKVYLGAQVDDMFLSEALWEVGTPCGTNFDTLRDYRNTGADWNALVAWQRAKRSQPMTADLQLAMAYNGVGTDPTWYADHLAGDPVEADRSDTLTPAVRATQGEFEWISHTWTHQNLDYFEYPKPPAGTPFTMSADDVTAELVPNHDLAVSLGLTNYTRKTLVQPEVSGLRNPEAMQALYDHGVRYVVSDTSRGGDETNPSPNAGVRNALEPDILQIPRRPTNLYFNVSTPAEWLAEDNCMYPAGQYGHVNSYDALLEREATVIVGQMLRGDIDPFMFHGNNVRAYDGTRSLLGDLLDRVLQKYGKYFTLPVQTLTMEEIGQSMLQRMAFDASGAYGHFVPTAPDNRPGAITIGAQRAASVPVTGLLGATGESYGGQTIARVTLTDGQSRVFNDGGGGDPTPPPAATRTLNVSPTALGFAARRVGTQSPAAPVTISNTGTGAVALQPATVGGSHRTDFLITATTCGSSLAAGATCQVSVAFKPTVVGDRSANLLLASDAANGPHTVPLTGVGTAPSGRVSPTFLAFGSVARNTVSAPQTVTVTNAGNAPMNIKSFSIGGKNPGQFRYTTNCPWTIEAGASCTLSVTFAPTSKGTKTAELRIATNAPEGTLRVQLSGTGT